MSANVGFWKWEGAWGALRLQGLGLFMLRVLGLSLPSDLTGVSQGVPCSISLPLTTKPYFFVGSYHKPEYGYYRDPTKK